MGHEFDIDRPVYLVKFDISGEEFYVYPSSWLKVQKPKVSIATPGERERERESCTSIRTRESLIKKVQ